MVIDLDTIQVQEDEITPKPGTSYADRANPAKVKKPQSKEGSSLKENFPTLLPPTTGKTPKAVKPGTEPPVKPPRVKPTGKLKNANKKARSTAVGPRFEIIGEQGKWPEIRKSIEQKISFPRVRISNNENGIILFPEDKDTLSALRRTSNLAEKKPPLPRLIISGVDRLLERKVLPWSLVNQNCEHLGLTDADAADIRPLFKTGPRDRVTVNWVGEVRPELLPKLEGKVGYLGFSKCRMRSYSSIPQCQKHGHTAARCRANAPICRNCSGSHDSRTCKSENMRYANCKKKGHKASSSNCPAKLAAVRSVLRLTDFGILAPNLEYK